MLTAVFDTLTWWLSVLTALVLPLVLGTKVHHVTWSNCGKISDPVQIKALSVASDGTNGHFSISGEVRVKYKISAPIKADVRVQVQKMLTWLPVPCVLIGGCQHPDVCTLSPYQEECPPRFREQKVPCKCPVEKGTYRLDKFALPLTLVIPQGRYWARVVLSEFGERLACYEAYFDIVH